MPRPTLDDSFRSGPPRRSPEEYHGWMTAEECPFILWGLTERWPAARIGRAFGGKRGYRQTVPKKFLGGPRAVARAGSLRDGGPRQGSGIQMSGL